jgi:hypothetical protein
MFYMHGLPTHDRKLQAWEIMRSMMIDSGENAHRHLCHKWDLNL